MSRLYSVTTWDTDLQKFTPQIGLPEGPFTIWQVREALRQLKDMGYQADRDDDWVLVERVEPALTPLELIDYVPLRERPEQVEAT